MEAAAEEREKRKLDMAKRRKVAHVGNKKSKKRIKPQVLGYLHRSSFCFGDHFK